MATVAQLLAEGRTLLAGEDGRREAELLLAAALGHDRAWLRAHDDAPVSIRVLAGYRDWLRRRAGGEPVAYLLGAHEFWSLPLTVSPAVLIPRPDTERLVELTLMRLPHDRPCRVADLGTGSGAIALAIAHERPRASLVATDASADALAIARANAERLGLGERIVLRAGDWCEALAGELPFDVIASNPPYVAVGDRHVREGDLRFEPRRALVAGRDGLDAIRRIVADAGAYLLPDGWLLLEHGFEQGSDVRALMMQAGFADIGSDYDLAGHERVSFGRWPMH